MAKVNLGYLEQALDGRIQVPFEAIQALDVIMRHLPSQKYAQQCDFKECYQHNSSSPLSLELCAVYNHSLCGASTSFVLISSLTFTTIMLIRFHDACYVIVCLFLYF